MAVTKKRAGKRAGRQARRQAQNPAKSPAKPWPKNADLVYPDGNEPELAQQARALGYSAIIFCYDMKKQKKKPGVPELDANLKKPDADPKTKIKIKTYTACIATTQNDVQKARGNYDYVLATPERALVEDKRVDALIGTGLLGRKDATHFRRSLTQVEADLAKRHGKTIVCSLADLHATSKKRQPELLGRWTQDATILAKKNVPLVVVTGAREPLQLRGRKDLDAFARSLLEGW